MPSFEKERDRHTLVHLEGLRKGLLCEICGNFLRDAYNLPCGHNFCLDCVDDALADSGMCPSCKNPAWSKDTVKNAHADSAVHDWVNHCETKYQHFVAQAAEDDGDESDSVLSEASENSIDNEEETSPRKPSPVPTRHKKKTGKEDDTFTMADAKASANDSSSEVRVNRSISRPQKLLEGPVSCTTNTPSKRPAGTMVDHSPSTPEQEDGSIPSPSSCSGSSNAAPGRARSFLESGEAEVNPSSGRSIVHTRPPSTSPAVRYDQAQTANEAGTVDTVTEETCRPATPGKPHCKHSEKDSSSGETSAERSEKRQLATPRLEAPRFPHINSGDSKASVPQDPLVARGRGNPGLSFSHAPAQTSSGATLLSLTANWQNKADEVLPPRFSHFSESLPDTCDVLDLDSPQRSSAKSIFLIATPPILKSPPAEVERVEPTSSKLVLRRSSSQDGSGEGKEQRCAEADGRSPAEGVPMRGQEDSSVGVAQRTDHLEASYNQHQSCSEIASIQESQGRISVRCDGEDDTVGSLEPNSERPGNEFDAQCQDGDDIGDDDDDSTDLDEPPPKDKDDLVSPAQPSAHCNNGAAGSVVGVDGDGDNDSLATASPPCSIGARREGEKIDRTLSPASPDSASLPILFTEKNEGGRAAKGGPTRPEHAKVDEDTKEQCESPEIVFSCAVKRSVQQHVSPVSSSSYLRSMSLDPEAQSKRSVPVPRSSRLWGDDFSPARRSNPRAQENGSTNVYDQLEVAPTETHQYSGSSTAGSAFRKDYDLEQVTLGASRKRSMCHAAGDILSAAKNGFPTATETKISTSQRPFETLDVSRLNPTVNERGQDESDSTIAADDGMDDASRTESLLDVPRNRAGIFKSPSQDIEQKARGSDHAAGWKQCGTSGKNLYVPETLAPNSLTMDDFPAAKDTTSCLEDECGDRGRQQVPETAGTMVVMGPDMESQVQETLASGGVVSETNKDSLSEDVRSYRLSEGYGQQAETSRAASPRTETADGSDAEDIRAVDPTPRQDVDEAEIGVVQNRERCTTKFPAVNTAEKSTMAKMAAPAKRFREQENDRSASLRSVQETASLHDLSQEEPETLVYQEVPETAVYQEVPETAVYQEVPETVVSQEVPETVVSQEVPETVVPQEVSETVGAVCEMNDFAVEAENNRQTAESSDETRNSSSLQTSQVPETPQLLPTGSTENQNTADDAIGGGSDDGNAGGKDVAIGTPVANSSESSRKRSADSVALSPERFGSGGKRLKASPYEGSTSVKVKTPDRAGYTLDAGEARGANDVVTGTPIVLRGGSGSGGSDNGRGSELSPGFSPAAACSHRAMGGHSDYDDGDWPVQSGTVYEYDEHPALDHSFDDFRGDDMYYDTGDRQPTPPVSMANTYRPVGISSVPVNTVVNPYERTSHLEIQPDADDALEPSPTTKTSVAKRATGQTLKEQGNVRPKKAACRPSSAMMGFGAPSRGNGLARGPSALGIGAVDTRKKESEYRASSNTILAAGRGTSGSLSPVHGSVNGIASYLTYEETLPSCLAPDTQEIDALQAEFVAKGALERGYPSTADMEIVDSVSAKRSRLPPVNRADDDDKEHNRSGRRLLSDAPKRSPVANKRPRSSRNTKVNEGDITVRQRKVEGTALDSSPVVLALLGCQEWELNRAKLLCSKLRQSHLHTQLVRGATHLVLGSAHTATMSGDDDDSDSDRSVRRQLVTHELAGYREAVMLGLWVLDFSWVEASLKLKAGESRRRSGGSGRREGAVAHPLLLGLAPARDFEVIGCFHKHDGCDPRRGRMRRAAETKLRDGFIGAERIFSGFDFHIVVAVAQTARSKTELLDGDEAISKLTRLLVLGGGEILMGGLSSRPAQEHEKRKHKRTAGSWSHQPFASEVGISSDDDNERSTVDETSGRVVVVALADKADGEVSSQLARAALDRKNELSAVAAVSNEWVVRSIEDGSRLEFELYSLRTNHSQKRSRSDVAPSISPQKLLKSRLALDSFTARDGLPAAKMPSEGKETGEEEQPRRNDVQRVLRRSSHSKKLQLRRAGGSGVGGSREVVINVDKMVGHGSGQSRPRLSLQAQTPADAMSAAEKKSAHIRLEAQKVIDSGHVAEQGGMLKERRTREREDVGNTRRTSEGSTVFKLTRVGDSKKVASEDVQIGPAEFWDKNYSANLMKKAGIEEDPNDKGGRDYNALNTLEKRLWQVLHDAGYLQMPREQELGEFWFECVYDGIIGKRASRWHGEAKERGCPMKVIRKVFTKEDGQIFSENVEQRLRELEAGEDFRPWQGDNANEAGAKARAEGSSIGDALQVL